MKKFNKVMLLVIMVGVNLSAVAPTNVSHGKVTCPANKSLVSIDHQNACCPSCSAGKVARVDGDTCVCEKDTRASNISTDANFTCPPGQSRLKDSAWDEKKMGYSKYGCCSDCTTAGYKSILYHDECRMQESKPQPAKSGPKKPTKQKQTKQ